MAATIDVGVPVTHGLTQRRRRELCLDAVEVVGHPAGHGLVVVREEQPVGAVGMVGSDRHAGVVRVVQDTLERCVRVDDAVLLIPVEEALVGGLRERHDVEVGPAGRHFFGRHVAHGGHLASPVVDGPVVQNELVVVQRQHFQSGRDLRLGGDLGRREGVASHAVVVVVDAEPVLGRAEGLLDDHGLLGVGRRVARHRLRVRLGVRRVRVEAEALAVAGRRVVAGGDQRRDLALLDGAVGGVVGEEEGAAGEGDVRRGADGDPAPDRLAVLIDEVELHRDLDGTRLQVDPAGGHGRAGEGGALVARRGPRLLDLELVLLGRALVGQVHR